jgi:hypothetical protein
MRLPSASSSARVACGLALLLCVLVAAPFRETAASQAHTQLLVIAHPSVGDTLDTDGLRAVFLRKRMFWSDKRRIVPLNYPAGHPLRASFDRALLGFSGDESARYWIDERIRHGTEAPMSIATESLLARVVKQLPGSIGYVPAGTAPAGVRVIARLDGDRVVAP